MDRRGWPWKKKSSDKVTKTDKPFVTTDSVGSTLSSVAHLGNQVYIYFLILIFGMEKFLIHKTS